MKINKMIGSAIIALLAIGAMGFITTHSFAQAPAAKIQQVQPTGVAPDTAEDPARGADTDKFQDPSGDQTGNQVEDSLPDVPVAPGTQDSNPTSPLSTNPGNPTTQGVSFVVAASQANSTLLNASTVSQAVQPADITEDPATGPDTHNVQDQSGDQSGNQVEDGSPDVPGAPAQ